MYFHNLLWPSKATQMLTQVHRRVENMPKLKYFLSILGFYFPIELSKNTASNFTTAVEITHGKLFSPQLQEETFLQPYLSGCIYVMSSTKDWSMQYINNNSLCEQHLSPNCRCRESLGADLGSHTSPRDKPAAVSAASES